jgi:hypothetical protein
LTEAAGSVSGLLLAEKEKRIGKRGPLKGDGRKGSLQAGNWTSVRLEQSALSDGSKKKPKPKGFG